MRLPLLTNALAFATTAAVAASSLDTTHQLNARKSSITPITVKGNAFFKGNDRFYIRGVYAAHLPLPTVRPMKNSLTYLL